MTMIDPPRRRDQADANARTAYLVLGMHRSGTSAITQLLSLAGAQLPKNLMPGDEHNAQGYFEPWRIATFNDERLRAAGSAWDDVFAFPCPVVAESAATDWRARAGGLFRAEFGARRFPLMKDPRVTVLLPFWREVFADVGVAARCVIPVRHPLAVAGSLARRDGFKRQKSVLLWSAYMLAAEAYSRDLPRAFVGYDQLLANWRTEVARIERSHGAALPKLGDRAERDIDAALTSDLRHNRDEGDLASLGWAGEIAATVYDWFAAAAQDEKPSVASLETAAAALASRQREVGALVSPATRDLDAARSELHGLRQKLAWQEGEQRQLQEQFDTLLARFEALQRDWWTQKGVMEEAEWALDDILAR